MYIASEILPLAGCVGVTLLPSEGGSRNHSCSCSSSRSMVEICCRTTCCARVMDVFEHHSPIRQCFVQLGLQFAYDSLWELWKTFRKGLGCFCIHWRTYSSNALPIEDQPQIPNLSSSSALSCDSKPVCGSTADNIKARDHQPHQWRRFCSKFRTMWPIHWTRLDFTIRTCSRLTYVTWLWLLQVCSIVEVGGLVICLHAASKISHRAQALGSVTSRWHAMVTCSSKDAPRRGTNNSSGNLGITNSSGNLEISIAASLPISYSESDLEAVDYVPKPTNTQLASHMSLYQKRQSFGMPLQLPHVL